MSTPGTPGGPAAPAALAIDVGGTKLTAGVVDRHGRLLGRARRPAPATTGPADADRFYLAVLACATAALADAGTEPAALAGVGVACGGPMRWPDGVVSTLNIPAWRGFPLRDRLVADLGVPTVLVHNDAVAITVGEHWRGAGTGTGDLLGVTISTGIGGGLVLDGRLHHGRSGNAGHIGHIVVEPDGGPPCGCGGTGCLEAVASGPNTVRRALAAGWRPADGPADGVALARAAAAGEPVARHELARAGRGTGVALAGAAATLDVDLVVVAGGFSRAGDGFWGPLRAAWQAHARLPFTATTRVVASTLGDDVNLLGAAAFVLEPDRYGWRVPAVPAVGVTGPGGPV